MEQSAARPRLRNVHTHLKSTVPVEACETADLQEVVVSGDYDYYHFGQDGEDDHVRRTTEKA